MIVADESLGVRGFVAGYFSSVVFSLVQFDRVAWSAPGLTGHNDIIPLYLSAYIDEGMFAMFQVIGNLLMTTSYFMD